MSELCNVRVHVISKTFVSAVCASREAGPELSVAHLGPLPSEIRVLILGPSDSDWDLHH